MNTEILVHGSYYYFSNKAVKLWDAQTKTFSTLFEHGIKAPTAAQIREAIQVFKGWSRP